MGSDVKVYPKIKLLPETSTETTGILHSKLALIEYGAQVDDASQYPCVLNIMLSLLVLYLAPTILESR